MRFSLIAPLAFAITALAAPVDECEFLKPLSILEGAQIFCANRHPTTAEAVAPVADKPKTNAKRFTADNERVVRILGGMPEARQKVFCACYPAVATTSVSVSVSATPSASASASSVPTPSVASSVVASATSTPTA
ncbi:hypothetical protein CC86DRAFT_312154 [Ophiobolus disseminans]|uniref:Uncharacterized protein n=1 Tax=Ophiobolus disseminans TaxID=1469910 RepID=A0A6A7AKZ7_9PLEO|nr:hypothetical protein CC86DRAFT_312154 [Ophiobolus disseminans]